MNLQELLSSMGLVGWCVIATLLLLSVYSMSVIVSKLRHFRAASSQSRVFLPDLARCLREGRLRDAIEASHRHGESHVARVVSSGVAELVNGACELQDAGGMVETVSRALDRAMARTSAEMRKGLGGLATIGSTAPFIGLFGTVVGIIHSFQGIAASGSGGVAAVSGGIAEALIATAFGLLVAVPAVMAFNYFTGVLEHFQVEMSNSSAELVDFIIKSSGTPHASR